jgi:hypothetical protein
MLKFRKKFSQNLSLFALGIAWAKWLLLSGSRVFLRTKVSSNARPGYLAQCNNYVHDLPPIQNHIIRPDAFR